MPSNLKEYHLLNLITLKCSEKRLPHTYFEIRILMTSDRKKEYHYSFYKNNNKVMVREIKGLKCPNHDYLKDNHHFMYQEAYSGARPTSSTRCMKCGYTMSLHKAQK